MAAQRLYLLFSAFVISSLAVAGAIPGADADAPPADARLVSAAAPGTTGKQTLASSDGLPLAFVANAGQLDPRVRYSAQADRTSFYFTRQEAVFSFGGMRKSLALRLRFLGANRRAAITGLKPADGRVNYLIGNDPSRWQTRLPTYSELVYRNVWPGIDLRFRGEQGQLEV